MAEIDVQEGPTNIQSSAWIVSFGPIGSGSDGYIVRVESNARALATLGFAVHVLDVSRRKEPATPWPGVETHPAWPSVVSERRIFGPVDLLADLRGQLALIVGLLRNWKSLRAADAVICEGGLLAATFVLRVFRRRRSPIFVFDPITVMSSLHRDTNGICTVQCKSRRLVWRLLEWVCIRCSDLTVVGCTEDALRFRARRVAIVPHAVLTERLAIDSREDPNLIGFLGNGGIGPNREAVDFIAQRVLGQPGLDSVTCRVIGDINGYDRDGYQGIEFVGFFKDPSQPLSPVSVGCAPMSETGGVSTKVVAYLVNGKRTVCTAEAARGIAVPPNGLWVAERDEFAKAVAVALAHPWSSTRARALQEWMVAHHGLDAVARCWSGAVTNASTT
ncbi:MAG TPA: hypothetical protein VGU71_16035 [Candidatus Dormibacteraeota bacterium]|nr:hypothetical protein [Candidatus Dormibacteraeota bacterium]